MYFSGGIQLMKKLNITTFSISLIVILFLIIQIGFTMTNTKASLELLNGNVKYKFTENAKWTQLGTTPSEIKAGCIIVTGSSSRAKLTFDDGSMLVVEENSNLKIHNDIKEKNKSLFNFKLVGNAFVELKKKFGKDNELRLETPTALATIRGTKVKIWTDTLLTSHIALIDGNAQIQSTYIAKGQINNIEPMEDGKSIITLTSQEQTNYVNTNNETIITKNLSNQGQPQLNIGDEIAVYGTIQDNNMIATLIMYSSPGAQNYMNQDMVFGWLGIDLCPPTLQLAQPMQIPPGTIINIPVGGIPSNPVPAPIEVIQIPVTEAPQTQEIQLQAGGDPNVAGQPSLPGLQETSPVAEQDNQQQNTPPPAPPFVNPGAINQEVIWTPIIQ